MLTVALVCLALIGVPFVLYPLILFLHARIAPDIPKRSDYVPDVDLVICAHNEADHIAQKLKNVEALRYPPEKLKIWVASDGSTDETVSLARKAASNNVTVLDLPRTGKAGALVEAVGRGEAEVIAFSDANSDWEHNALRNMTGYLEDPAIGGVAGDQRYGEGANADGERGYWNFDRSLKKWQAEAGSVVSATGAIYCIRRIHFQPPPPDATDDFMISTGPISDGKRLHFALDAVAWEAPADGGKRELARKVRIITRGLRSVYYRRDLLNPGRTGLYALKLFVHKVWRRMVWIPLAILAVVSPALLSGDLPEVLIGSGTLAFVLLGIAGANTEIARRFKPAAIAYYIWLVNLACAIATYNFLAGRKISHWNLPRGETERGQFE